MESSTGRGKLKVRGTSPCLSAVGKQLGERGDWTYLVPAEGGGEKIEGRREMGSVQTDVGVGLPRLPALGPSERRDGAAR